MYVHIQTLVLFFNCYNEYNLLTGLSMMVESINRTTSEFKLKCSLICVKYEAQPVFCLLTVTHSRKSRTTLRRCGGSTGSPWSTSTMRDPLSFHH